MRDEGGARRPAGPDDIERLEARIESLERDLSAERQRLREAEATARAEAAQREQARLEREALVRRRAVRWSLAASARLRQVIVGSRRATAIPRRTTKAIRRAVDDRRRQAGLRASEADERTLATAIHDQTTTPAIRNGPLVSIVILNRDGRAHLDRCLRGIARTAYRDIEVIVVDNGSTDGSPDLVERLALPFPVTLVRNETNHSFSAANGQGVEAATGELICFLNNDVEPIMETWLGSMVETMTSTDAAAVGARLVFPGHRGGRRAGSKHADLTIQHGGVAFDRREPIPLARVIGAGDDPLAPEHGAIGERPALTAACLLVRRSAFEAVGGFSHEYDYGIEDVDLCLRLTAAGGRLVYDGRAALWHHESATRIADRARYAARVEANRRVYHDHWGPRIFRECLLDVLDGPGKFSNAPFHVAITVTSLDERAGYGDWYTGHGLGAALEAIGWRVSYLERAGGGWYRPDASVEAVIVLLDACDIRRLPRRLITLAWMRNWPERWIGRPWFDDYDLVFASSERIVEMVKDRTSKVARLLPLATDPGRFANRGEGGSGSPPSCDVLFVGSYWNDERAVVEALPALAASGVSVRVHGRGWDALPAFASIDHGYLAHDELPRAYASARIVIDDAASSTRSSGSVNSRVFDALAVGAVVISNGAEGVHELFGPSFPTWSDAASLVASVRSILDDPGPAAAQAAIDRAIVLTRHTYALRAATVRDALVAWVATPRYGLRVGVPNWERAEAWGDYHFARSLQRALERAGIPTRVHFRPDWDAPVAAREDVTVHLFGLREAPTRPGQVDLLWQISHPDLASAEIYGRYDHAFVASDVFAEHMASLVETPVTSLHQATDPERFVPDTSGPHHELLFVANSRRVRRRVIEDLGDTTHDLAVYGRGWTPALIDPRFVRGERIPNDELGRAYGSASIVLNDHWDDMRSEGFISNRLYDALASGAFVISDHVDGIDAEFEGAVPTYRTSRELHALIERYLADPEARRRAAEAGRRVVLDRHTFDHRVTAIRDVAEPLIAERPTRVIEDRR